MNTSEFGRIQQLLVVFLFVLLGLTVCSLYPLFGGNGSSPPSCTCPEGNTGTCPYTAGPPTDFDSTIWVEKSGGQYIIHGGNQDGDLYDPGVTTLQGTSGSDCVIGTDQGDVIHGLEGNDKICGRKGDDEISGGSGNDYICGGQQNDLLSGNAGNDVIEGNKQRDEIDGGPNNDCLYGNKQNDVISGGSGDNYIDGGQGNDDCYDAVDTTRCEGGSGLLKIQLEKKTRVQGDSSTFEDADLPPGPNIGTDQTVEWEYEVTRFDTSLNNITITDDMGTSSDSSDDYTCTVNFTGNDDSATCPSTNTADAQMGQYSNEAEASVTQGGETYTDTDPSHYFGTEFNVAPQDTTLKAQITQEGNLDTWNSGTISNIQFSPCLEVTFAYPAGYEVEVDYTVDLTEASPSSLSNDNELLILDSVTNHGGSIDAYIPSDTVGVSPLKLRDEGDFTDENEFTQKYDLYVNPRNLVEDYAAEDKLEFTINFTVSDDSP